MTDRELLELAAKAAGIVLYVKQQDGERVPDGTHARIWDRPGGKLTVLFWNDNRDHPMCRKPSQPGNVEWNPLTDDGDALRLAVKAGMELSADDEAGHAPFAYARVKGCGDSYVFEPIEDDPCRALRRAIVRAAAAVGEQS